MYSKALVGEKVLPKPGVGRVSAWDRKNFLGNGPEVKGSQESAVIV